MKKVLLIGMVGCLYASHSFAQYVEDYARDFKPFRVGVGIGYAVPGAEQGGVLGYIEPAYRATDHVAVALRVEAAFLVRGLKSINADETPVDKSPVVSYTFNSHYYLNNENVRPFIGAGVGLFHTAAATFNIPANGPDADNVEAETRFGFYPQVGIDAGHLNFTLEYNVVPPTDVPGGGEVKNSYLGIRAGVSVGGGRKSVRR